MCAWSRRRTIVALGTMAILFNLSTPAGAQAAEDPIELVEGTAILLSQSDGGGSGGNATSTGSATNIFSPAAHVDYKRFGGEPTVVVDRYPFTGTLAAQHCPAGQTSCFLDLVYQSAPQGFVFPHYSQFWKSEDLGASFRKPVQIPIHGETVTNQGGGGDSHQVVGHRTHKVYFVDLPLDCVTMNVSSDLGETFVSDQLGCGINAGVDDRQWVEEDESFPATMAQGGSVYVSFIQFVNLVAPTLSLARSTHGAAVGSFATDSLCNTLTVSTPPAGAADATPTPCPDPSDPRLWVAGPPVADKEGYSGRPTPSHRLYIPFVRAGSALSGGPPWDLYVAISTDGGTSWTRRPVASLGGQAPDNIFPQLTVDRGGNLYYTWSQEQPDGEQDVYYAFSTTQGQSWSPPINLTKENNDTAIFPWLVAGDPGRVDAMLYKANTGINSNIAFVDAAGNECEEGDPGCGPNPSVWNVYFGQSMNALNTGPNFKFVQVSAQPNHIGQICTAGLACEGDRDLLDFATVAVDHLGAAHIAYSDDHVRRNSDTRDRMTRQLSGSSVYKNQNINLLGSWPVRDHRVADAAGDVFNTAGLPANTCPGMDLLGMNVDRNDDFISISLTLNGPPSAGAAIDCTGGIAATGGLWGAEFWSATSESTTPDQGNEFYIAYRDNPPDGAPAVEAGVVDDLNLTITSMELRATDPGSPSTPGGTCFTTPTPTPCTLTVSARASDLGIKPGAGLYSMTGLSLYFFGTQERPPLLRVEGGNSEQADVTPPFHYMGTGAV
jgi:hypothetical protein